MNKKKSKPVVVKLAIFTVITVFIWIGFEVYRALTQRPAPEVPAEVLKSLDPSLDTNSLGKLENRLYLKDEEIGDTVLVSPENLESLKSIVTKIETEEATPGGEATGAATEATEEGEIINE